MATPVNVSEIIVECQLVSNCFVSFCFCRQVRLVIKLKIAVEGGVGGGRGSTCREMDVQLTFLCLYLKWRFTSNNEVSLLLGACKLEGLLLFFCVFLGMRENLILINTD